MRTDVNTQGPVKSRSCTDILCLLLFIAFLGGWGAVAYISYTIGDPNKLIYPTDSMGQMCGMDEPVKDKPYLLFFDLMKCASPTVLYTGCMTPQVCVKECPKEAFAAYPYFLKEDREARKKLICKYGPIPPSLSIKQLVEQDYCAAWYLESKPIAGRCMPNIYNDKTETVVMFVSDKGSESKMMQRSDGTHITVGDLLNASQALAAFTSASEVGTMAWKDVRQSWLLILGGLIEAMVICFLWICLMRCLACLMVWLSLFAVIGLLGLSCWFSYTKYESLKDVQGANRSVLEVKFEFELGNYFALRDTWLYILVASAVVLAIVLLLVLVLRKRIVLAIALIKEASKAVSAMTSSLVFPIIPWILEVTIVMFSLSVALFLTSSGKPVYSVKGLNGTTVCSCLNYKEGDFCDMDVFRRDCQKTCPEADCLFLKYEQDEIVTWLQLYNLFGLFWGICFVSAFGEMVLAGAFSTWYWTFNKSKVPVFALTSSVYRTLRYHIGTIAFGSLLIAICRMIRVLLEYVDRKLKKYDNAFTKCILCCLKCCFWCLENFLKFLNRNAYIMCAMYGNNFCHSAKDAFFLLVRNILRVFVLDKVTDFLLFLGKLVVVGVVAGTAFWVFDRQVSQLNDYVPALHYPLFPVLILAFGTYVITNIFFGVYSMAVDTLFLCFLEDSEKNDGSEEKPYFMSKNLMKILGKKNKFENAE